MIADHLVTRAGVRSLGLLISGVVPMASSYFCYMIAYNESPFDTLISHIPSIVQLLHANASTLESPLHSDRLVPGESLTSLSSAASIATELPKIVSPAMSTLAAALRRLESHGYRNRDDIPGYHYLLVLQPLKKYFEPFLRFISSHQTLSFILTLLHLWMAAELVFYVMFWKRLGRLQQVDRALQGVASKTKRKELFQRCLETVGEGDSVKKWIEFWFDTGRKRRARFEDIGRLNMIRWLAWAFWAAPAEEVSRSTAAEQELNQMIDTIERAKKVKFAEGFNPDVDCIRLCLDPILATHRPLLYYTLLWLLNAFTGLVFRISGFTRHDSTLEPTFDRASDNKLEDTKSHDGRRPPDLAYWHRSPAKPENEVPLVFIPGVGIGLVQYIHFIVALAFISRPLIVIEVPYVSSQLFQVDCMTPDETYFAIERILKTHNHPKATFMGHSLGTMLCAAVCRASSANSPESVVAGLVLVDPICFLTHHSIAHNFAYRTPSTACHLVMELFATREIGTSWYIMRRFCWNQSIMFPIAWTQRNQKPLPFQGPLSPVLPEKTRVFLSRNDSLLDMTNVQEYLKTQVGLKEGQEEEDELAVMEGMDHAQFLLRPDWFARIVQAAREC